MFCFLELLFDILCGLVDIKLFVHLRPQKLFENFRIQNFAYKIFKLEFPAKQGRIKFLK